MTINNEQIQALKAAAIAVGRDGRTDDEWFHYLQCVHYKFILSLLADRDADKALIAEQEKRIAELEARTVIVKLPEPKESGPGWKIDPEFISKVQDAIGHDDECECWEGTPSMEIIEAVLLAAAGITLVVGE